MEDLELHVRPRVTQRGMRSCPRPGKSIRSFDKSTFLYIHISEAAGTTPIMTGDPAFCRVEGVVSPVMCACVCLEGRSIVFHGKRFGR